MFILIQQKLLISLTIYKNKETNYCSVLKMNLNLNMQIKTYLEERKKSLSIMQS